MGGAGTPKQSDIHVIKAWSDSSKGHMRPINDMGHCAKLSLPGTRTGQSREVEQRVGDQPLQPGLPRRGGICSERSQRLTLSFPK